MFVEVEHEIQDPTTSAATQTIPPRYVKTSDSSTMTSSAPGNVLSADSFINDADGLHHFSGLKNYAKFRIVLASLGPASSELQYMYNGPAPECISTVDKFFMVLVKLRKHYTNVELSRKFHITEADVYNIFCTWVRFMSLQWRELPLWISRDLARFHAPSDFNKKHPSL